MNFLQISRLKDVGGEVAAWVVIPNEDNSSLIHHMGSQKGREFIQCKPDIDAELHVFLRNYKKKGNKNINIKLQQSSFIAKSRGLSILVRYRHRSL